MSVEAISAVLRESDAKLATRLVALALANHAHADGSNAFPSVPTLAAAARCDERTAQRALRWLERHCEIVPTGRTRYGVTVYHMTLVTPLALQLGDAEGGDKLPPEVGSLRGRLQGRFGRQDATPGAADCHPPGDIADPGEHGTGVPFAVQRWIAKHGHAVDEETGRDIFDGSFGLEGETLERAVDHLRARRRIR